MSTWLITGCSTGLGRALAEATLAAGENVVVTARDRDAVAVLAEQAPERALALALDVTDERQVAAAVRDAQSRFGAVDVLVNNAGYGYRAAVEEGEPDAVARLFATHFHGPVALIQAVLPGMRERRSGTIVNISSIGARISPVGSGYYAAAKAAQEAMTLSLRREIEPLGLQAMIVEPGAFRTDFAGRSLTEAATPIPDYAETAGRRRREHDSADGTQQGDPDLAAQAIITAVRSPRAPAMLVLGSDAVDGFRGALQALLDDVDAWEATSTSTSFDS